MGLYHIASQTKLLLEAMEILNLASVRSNHLREFDAGKALSLVKGDYQSYTCGNNPKDQ